MLDRVLLGEVRQLGHGIGADAHDVGVGGFELRKAGLEAADFSVQAAAKTSMNV